MWRVVLGIAVGFLVWWVIGTAGFVLLHVLWNDYAAAAPFRTFTFAMLAARLLVSMVGSIGAGWMTARVVGRRSAAPWIVGGLLVILFLPIHYAALNDFPLWYHLFFLLTLAPIVGYSGNLAPGNARPAA